jgi:hypothetical protein
MIPLHPAIFEAGNTVWRHPIMKSSTLDCTPHLSNCGVQGKPFPALRNSIDELFGKRVNRMKKTRVVIHVVGIPPEKME